MTENSRAASGAPPAASGPSPHPDYPEDDWAAWAAFCAALARVCANDNLPPPAGWAEGENGR